MPQVLFDALPPNARVWVFGASASLDEKARTTLLHAIDEHLANWRAHGTPLVCARDWRDNRFLAVGVDEAATGASGCSIDGIFRVLQSLQEKLGTQIVGGGTIYWREASGAIQSGGRMAFVDAVANGKVVGSTPVFDLTVSTVGEWRENFERAASSSWHAKLLKSAGVANE